mmetsp:Transcript_31203/g.82716  ORF Transcript_31203/g.82716 Transcript_31203/m.82716 type:complete len:238 (-) Transcript_31203:277-990(-)
MNRWGRGGLEGARDEVGAERADVGEVHGRHDHLDLVKDQELGGLGDELAVDPDHGAAVEVQPAAVATLHVRVQVDAARLGGGAPDEVDPLVELAELVVAPGPVGDDLDAVQGQRDVRSLRGEELLARLEGYHRVQGRDGKDAHRDLHLARDLLDPGGQEVLLDLAEARLRGVYVPRREVPHLAVVPVVRQVELGPDADHLVVEHDDAAVVRDVPVHHRHADVAEDALRHVRLDDLPE